MNRFFDQKPGLLIKKHVKKNHKKKIALFCIFWGCASICKAFYIVLSKMIKKNILILKVMFEEELFRF